MILAGLGAAALFLLPGLAVVSLLGPRRSLSAADRFGLACGVGLCVHPLAVLWLSAVNGRAGPWLVWTIVALSAVRLITVARRDWHPPTAWPWFSVFLGLLFLSILITRMASAADMLAPAWGDGVHHAMIVQLLLDHGGLFQSWAPYAPIESFTYHFGFHANAAAWAWASGMSAVPSTLVTGQVCNALAVAALYPLGTRLSGTRWGGAAAMMIAGLFSTLPAFYLNWGRYTHLSALAILPGLLWCFDVWWVNRRRPPMAVLALASVLAAGLFLAHFRLAIIAGAAAAAWATWGAVRRSSAAEWTTRTVAMGAAGLAAVLLLAPQWRTLTAGRYTSVMGLAAPDQTSLHWQDLANWALAPQWPVALCLAAAGLALWYRARLVWPLLLWCGAAFFVTNPFLVGLPGTGWVMNDMLIYSLYVPVSLCLGWACASALTTALALGINRLVIGSVVVAALAIGTGRQRNVADPFFQMVMPSDVEAFEWIRRHVPGDALFLVNGFIGGDHIVVGSDAGWWLPFYTQRRNTVPPSLYHTEVLSPALQRQTFIDIVTALQPSAATPLDDVVARFGITHIYLGEQRGRVGYGQVDVLPESRLRASRATLLFSAGRAQVWGVSRPVPATAGTPPH